MGLSNSVTVTAISTVHNSDRDWYSITHTGNPGNPIPRDCKEVYQRGCTQDGVYTIDPHCPNQKPFQVYCNNQYTVFQRRMDGSENFNRGWDDYVMGFGSVWSEQWLGLEKIHCLTTRTARTEMRIDMADFRGDKKYAYYNFFMVGNAASKYKLQVAGYSGTAGDSILYGSGIHILNGMAFSTHDRDNDLANYNCAQSWKGGWWHNSCMCSLLNGIYHHDTTPRAWEAVYWHTFTGGGHSLKFAEMKLRARD